MPTLADGIWVPHFSRLDEYLGPWMVYPPAAEQFCRLVANLDLAEHVRAFTALPTPKVPTVAETVEAKNGRRVAIIPLSGPMMKGQSSLGGASTIAARRMVRQAATDPGVGGILLAFDSPGGTVAGTQDLADDVRAASRRKPVFAHADDLLTSAAYWVASQADEVWANAPSALVGSIGTVIEVREQAGRAERLGMKNRLFTTGPLKVIGEDEPITEEQAVYLQQLAEKLQAEFDTAVKRGRGLSAAQLKEVRSGAVYPASDAVGLGLLNGVRPLAATIDALAGAAK
jgi:signal peptide peptidase SppA